ncbi:MAG TPA: hypothetical protein VES20_13940 [Bryobacteraceae bacterium]|nr:hypothetical protein [Bryobacteraceae bacterium]
MTRVQRKPESGFALLVVLMMSAAVAILLYRELPRVAFESMRAKEEMLIERGEQYQRAVQLYANVIKRYPQTLEELEKTNGKRFLRRRYKDPFTGKDDWELLKVDAMGVITNSKVKKKKDEKKGSTNTFITEFTGLGDAQTSMGPQGVNIALRRRPSEGAPTDGGTGPAPLPLPGSEPAPPPPTPPVDPNANPNQAVNPNQDPNQNQNANLNQNLNQTANQTANQGLNQNVNQTANQGLNQPNNQPPGNLPPGLPQGVAPNQQQVQQAYPNGVPQAPGMFGPGQPQNQPSAPNAPGGAGRPGAGQPQGGALDMIRQALTSPSPNIPMNMGPGLQLGPGIVGVASKYSSKAIKIYNEQEEYDKWEFVYDPRKDKRLAGALAQAGGGQPGALPNNPVGTPMGNSSGIGGRPIGVGNPGIGSPGIGNNAPPSTGPGFNNSPVGTPGFGGGLQGGMQGGFQGGMQGGMQPGAGPGRGTGNVGNSGPAPIGSGYPPAIGSGYNGSPTQPSPGAQQQPQPGRPGAFPQQPGAQPGTQPGSQQPGAQQPGMQQPGQQPFPQPFPPPGNRQR